MKEGTDVICLYFGDPDECQNCGGSATLGGTQEALKTPEGTFCSADCHDEAVEFAERAKAGHRSNWCPECGFDNHEHSTECHAGT